MGVRHEARCRVWASEGSGRLESLGLSKDIFIGGRRGESSHVLPLITIGDLSTQ
jgi:hypothetical protein